MTRHNNLPLSQIYDANELESKGIREFFKIELKDGNSTVLYLTPHQTQEYNDREWENFPLKMTGVSQNTSGEMSRPKMTFANPNGVFSTWVASKVLEGSILTRYRVLISDIEAGNRAYQKQVWVIGKVVSLNKHLCVVELRSTLDGHNFQLPARSFYPPEFRYVTLR